MESIPEPIPHYYGNIVRKIFLICGLVMLITLPFLKENISSPVFYSILAILVLTFFAGMTNPKHKGIIVSDIVVSVLAFGIFTHQAITKSDGFLDLFFITNLVLSLLSLTAFYWSVKTIRWLKFPKKIPTENATEKIKGGGTREEAVFTAEIAATSVPTSTPTSSATSTAPPEIAKLTEEQRRQKRFLGSE